MEGNWWQTRGEPSDGKTLYDKYRWHEKNEEEKEAFDLLWRTTRLFLVIGLEVDKEQAKLTLEREGYRPVPEEELPKKIVNSVLSPITSLQANLTGTSAESASIYPAGQEALSIKEKIPVTIDTRPWAGKSAQIAYDALRKEEYHEDLIALVLVEKVHANKTEKGTLVGVVAAGDKTNRDTLDRRAARAKKMYNIKYI